MKTNITALEFFDGSILPIEKGEEISVNTKYYTIWKDKYITIPESITNFMILDFISHKVKCSEKFFNYVENDKLMFLKDINVIYDDKLNLFDSNFRRPAYWMRGKPVTSEQALEIISKTDTFFYNNPNHCSISFFASWWFDSCHYPYMYGWCRPDGRIGLDSITQKWSTAQEFIVDAIQLLYNFPYLDMIFIIWSSEEEQIFNQLHTNSYKKEYEFSECFMDNINQFIQCGLYIHDNCVELLNPVNTWDIFCKYNRLYGDDPITYVSKYNMFTKTKWVNQKYLRKCLEINKIDKSLLEFREYKYPSFDVEKELKRIAQRYKILLHTNGRR